MNPPAPLSDPVLPILPRPRLIRRILAALPQQTVCVVAPAGYGKSTLLRSLLLHVPNSEYVALGPGDAELSRLQARLATALQQATTLLLDDVHLLDESPTALGWLAAQMARAACGWVLAGRSIPPALLEREPIGSELLRVERADLAFRPAESRALLDGFDVQSATTWHDRVQGWPLALAMISMGKVDASGPAHSLGKLLGDGEPNPSVIFAYLTQAIFSTLPTPLLEFMRLTAFPMRFNDALLQAVFDISPARAGDLRAEILGRNLFLGPGSEPGWYAYHELIRAYLRTTADPSLAAEIAGRLVENFLEQGDPESAIEHALDGGLFADAARLMETHGPRLLLELGRLHNYRRWWHALPEETQNRAPLLLAQLGFAMVYLREDAEEGRKLLTRAQRLADEVDELAAREVTLRRATALHLSGQPTQALPLLLDALAYAGFPLVSGLRGRLYLAVVYARLHRLRDAARVYQEAERMVESLVDVEQRTFWRDTFRHNRGTGVLAPRGDFGGFAATLEQSVEADRNRPAALEVDFVGWAILHENLGEWDALAHDLAQIRAARLAQRTDQSVPDAPYLLSAKWEMFYWAVLWIGRGRFELAQSLIEQFRRALEPPGVTENAEGAEGAEVALDAEAVACGQWLHAWKLRAAGEPSACVEFVDSLGPEFSEAARFYRAALAWERAAAALFALRVDWNGGIEPHLQFHMQIGARHYLLRWRLLFLIACYRQGAAGGQISAHKRTARQEAERHLLAVLRALRRPHYETLLNQREPMLAAHFWSICLAQGLETERALAALEAIGQIDPVHTYLQRLGGKEPEAFALLQAVAAMGDERSIAFLDQLSNEIRPATSAPGGRRRRSPQHVDSGGIEQNSSRRLYAALWKTIDDLEAQPPPRLKVALMGDFSVLRRGVPLSDAVWPRPGVRHLFEYFCVNRGRKLYRDQILDEHWPDSDPEGALAAFRTSFSRLGGVLEPFLRKRTPMRYFRVEGESYTFDPDSEWVEVDYLTLIDGVARLEKGGVPVDDTHAKNLADLLSIWAPPLADVSYLPWALDAIERVTESYARGTLWMAQWHLAQRRHAEAAEWAEKGVNLAPWQEEGWQTWICATARMGLRTKALHLYQRTVAALAQELGAPPSAETNRLAELLRSDRPL